MRTSQTLNLEMSGARSALADVTARLNQSAAAGTDPSQEDIGKADAATREIRSMEVRYRAAVLTEENEDREARMAGEMDPETRELHGLETNSRMHRYIGAALEMRSVDGAEAELNSHLKIAGNRFPLQILAPSEAELRARETRAVTDAESTITPRSWIDRLFAETAASRIGVTMESVAPGVSSHPVTTAGAAFAMEVRGDDAADAAWTIGVSEAKPKRGAVRAIFNIEDSARLPGLEDALMRDLRGAMTEGVDRAIFKGFDGGSGTSGDIVGLQSAAIGETVVTQANKIKADKTLEAFSAMVDGEHAISYGDLNVVASVGSWRLWEQTIANSAVENMTIAAFLREAGLSWSSRGQISTVTTAGAFGAYVGRARGISGAAVAAVWSSGELIRDPYILAKSGQIALTINYLWDLVFARTSNFARIKYS